MNDLPCEVERVLSQVQALPCRSISISSYGAIQLGFGEVADHIIAGRYSKKRFQVELGAYISSWKYKCPHGPSKLLGPSDEQALASALLGETLVSIQVIDSCVVLTASSGGTVFIEGCGASEDIFYAHIRDGFSVFFNPEAGWSIEKENQPASN
jgi:hypothetical protein